MNRRLFPLVIILAVVCAAGLLLGGCGKKTVDPAELLDQAAHNAREAGTLHGQMNITLTPLEGETGMGLNVQGDAWLDMNTKVMEARFTVMGMELSLRYVEGKAYLQLGGKWYTLTGELMPGVGEGTIAALVKALASYSEVFSSTSEVIDLGEKKVGDYQCVNLEIVPDLAALTSLEAVQELAAELDMTAQEIEDYLQEGDLYMEVCVQEDEAIIREIFLTVNTELPEMGEIAGVTLLPKRAHVEMRIVIQEYGMPVEVQAPANPSPFKGLL